MPNKAEFIDMLAERLDGDRKRAAAALDAFIDSVYAAIGRGEKVAISGFGVFERRDRAARVGRNPLTGASVQVPARKTANFRPGTDFKNVANGARTAVSKAAGAVREAADAVRRTPAGKRAEKAATRAVRAASTAAPAKKAAAKKTAAKKAPAKKAAAKKTAAKKTAAKKAPAKKAVAKKTTAKKTAAKKAAKRA